MSSVGDGDRSDVDHLNSREPDYAESLSVWGFFHSVLADRAKFWRLIILLVVVLTGSGIVVIALKEIVG